LGPRHLSRVLERALRVFTGSENFQPLTNLLLNVALTAFVGKAILAFKDAYPKIKINFVDAGLPIYLIPDPET
jgi:hypothetical protein